MNLLRPGAVRCDFEGSASVCVGHKSQYHKWATGPHCQTVLQSSGTGEVGGGDGILLPQATGFPASV